MQKLDHLEIDGRLLETFLAVHEDRSVTSAAVRLATNQSTVSHRLDRLRELTGDALFVRAGRGIIPTPRAQELVPLARGIVDQMATMTTSAEFTVDVMDERFIIAATDYERALFVIDTVKQIMARAPAARFDFVWDKYDNGDALRHGDCDLAISPMQVRDNSGLHSVPLFSDTFRCFFDPACRSAPDSIESYAQARHVRIIFSASDTSFVDTAFDPQGGSRIIASELPSLNELPRLLRGTDLVATLPSRLADGLMHDFAASAVPFELPPLTFSLFWHRRTHGSPAHAWVREQLIAAAARLGT